MPEALVGGLTPGQALDVRLPLTGVTHPATVRAVTRATGDGRLFPVVVDLDAPVMPGSSAEVGVPVPLPEGVLAVPLAAVVSPFGTEERVMRVADGVVEEVPVTLAGLHGSDVLVRGPLAAGDAVITAGHVGVVDGGVVEVRR